MLNQELKNTIQEIKHNFGTPFWLYDESKILKRIQSLKKFDVIRYAQKANSNIHILKIMLKNEICVDSVSLGEIERANLAGFSNREGRASSIVYTSDIIDDETIRRVIELNIPINVGSPQMLEQIGRVKEGHRVWLRINPGFGHGHSNKTNTGGINSKHGNWHESLNECYELIKKYKLNLVGLHMHIGSGADYNHLSKVCDAMVKHAKECPFPIQAISAGGGIPVPYTDNEKEIDIEKYFSLWDKARKEIESFYKKRIILEIEPGSLLVSDSGYLVTEIRALKNMGSNNFVITNSGFNDLMRPAMYGSSHRISLIKKNDTKEETIIQPSIIAGSLCESGDVFTQDSSGIPQKINIPEPQIEDLIVIHNCGAYGASMSSNYNSKPLSPEFLLRESKYQIIRKKQSFSQLFQLELD
ncbi:diaminopimelate decarboxylase [Acinetobacter nectaris CIP 110549]|uniref:Diaminopimelate decarboxylase n=1 Tax=Acinetobacter nectaris CIP 110549 TaxID=1392540 RepID=V2TEL8_9GAMM|nr:diaminopimelate decarboxylase [Acinetobacter nectaris]ESK36256.1 diaminopimelate decarboxylase [Acinetobacter nectaris CIP 110549]